MGQHFLTRRRPDIAVRKMTVADAAAAATLSSELGYPATADEIKKRLERLNGLADHVVLAACVGELVVGWIDIAIAQHLQSEPYGEIGGLVVAHEYQGRGIGARLVASAEKWIEDRGITTVVVRSRVTREAAHAFYLARGFVRWKTSAVFTKQLGSARQTQ